MSTHNICFHGEIRKIAILLVENKSLSGAMTLVFHNTPIKVYIYLGVGSGLHTNM